MSTRRLVALAAALLVIGVVIDVAVGSSPVGFSAGVGLFGSATLILGSKWLGRVLLSRPEAYYADTDEPESKATSDAGRAD
jgi:hypothetical protein